jgi:hypothetical protein
VRFIRVADRIDRTAHDQRISLSMNIRTLCGFGFALLLSLSPVAHAARTFPQNSIQVKITDVADDAIVADGKALHLAPGVLIFTPSNLTIVRSALPTDVIARVQLDLNGDVRRIWLLADDEILLRPWWQFWKRDQPQQQKDQPQILPAPATTQ